MERFTLLQRSDMKINVIRENSANAVQSQLVLRRVVISGPRFPYEALLPNDTTVPANISSYTLDRLN
jgi:hypothetical protein